MTDLFKRSVPKTDFSQLHKLLHGKVKVGKTTLAAQMTDGKKEPLFIATEDGHHNLGVLVESVTDWPSFKTLVSKLKANQEAVKAQVSCVVIDLLSDIDQWCDEYVCKQLRISNLGDLDFGKGWTAKKREFQSVMAQLLTIAPCTFITHTKEKEVEVDGAKVDQFQPNLSGSTLDYINGKVDMIGFITPSPKDKKVYITFQPSKFVIAGTRFTHMAREFELNPTNMADSYKAINEAFINNKPAFKEVGQFSAKAEINK